MSYQQKAKAIYDMIFQGQLLEAFEQYYAENVVMEDVGETTREGKAACREYELKFLASVEAIHGGGVDAITADEANATTMVESWMDLTFKGGPRVNFRQVAVQKWEGDYIVHEKFYHK
jgi:SnoaL-like domain